MRANTPNRRRSKSEVVRGLETKASKIRALHDEGYARTEIRDYLDISYQHVRNVLVAPAPKSSAHDRRKRLSQEERKTMDAITQGLETKSDRIRALNDAGFARGDIARYLNILYQHVRNVVVASDGEHSTKPTERGLAEDANQYSPAGGDISNPTPSNRNDPVESKTWLDTPSESGLQSKWAKVGPEGQLNIPAAMLDALGLKPGDDVVVRYDDDELHITTRETAIKRAQAIVRQFVPEGVSLVDELIAERRAEAVRENDGANGPKS